jgi:hypothetical protein
MNKPLVAPNMKGITKKDMENAAQDAVHVTANSSIVRTLVNSMIASRRLYMLARSALDNEVQGGWDMDNKELVVQTLIMSVQDKANEKFDLKEVNQALLGSAIPFVDILIQQEKATGQGVFEEEQADDEEESVSGSADSSEA